MAGPRDRNRRRRRRGRFGFLYKLLSVVLIVAALTVAGLIFFRVDDIVVSGNQRYTQEQVAQASGVRQGDSLIALNKNRIAMTILRELPYVDKVSFDRQLPQTLVINVSESGAVAAVESEGTLWLLNYRGKVLSTTQTVETEALVTGLTPLRPTAGTDLAVGEEEQRKLDSLLELLGALKDEGLLEQVSEIDMSYESRITFLYDGRYTVRLPMTTDFAKKMRALTQVVTSERIGERGIIDFTIEELPHYIPEG